MNHYTYVMIDDVKMHKGLQGCCDIDNDFCVAIFVWLGDEEPDKTHEFWTEPGWDKRWAQIGQGTSDGQDWYDAALTGIQFSRECRSERDVFFVWDAADEEWMAYTWTSDWTWREERVC